MIKRIIFLILGISISTLFIGCGINEEITNNNSKKTVYNVELCYFEDESKAGFNTYPETSNPSLQCISDVLIMSSYIEYPLYKDKEKLYNLLKEIPLESFEDKVQYYLSAHYLDIDLTEEVESFLEKHYDQKNNIFVNEFTENDDFNNLIATQKCLSLADLYDIDINKYTNIKKTILKKIKEDNFYIIPNDFVDIFNQVLYEEGLCFKILSFFELEKSEIIEIDKYKKWLYACWDIIYQMDYQYDIQELWVINELSDINDLFNYNNNNIVTYINNLEKQANYYHLGYNEEVFCSDSQYWVEYLKLIFSNKPSTQVITEAQKYINMMIRSNFTRYAQTDIVPRDTYYGLIIGQSLNSENNINVNKIKLQSQEWIKEFNKSEDLSINSLFKGYYGLLILSHLEDETMWQEKEQLDKSIEQKIQNLTSINNELDDEFMKLHQYAILCKMKKILIDKYDIKDNNAILQEILELKNKVLEIENIEYMWDYLTILICYNQNNIMEDNLIEFCQEYRKVIEKDYLQNNDLHARKKYLLLASMKLISQYLNEGDYSYVNNLSITPSTLNDYFYLNILETTKDIIYN